MLIEVTPEQQKILMAIISQSQIRGADAPAIVELMKVVQTPKTIKKSEGE